MNQNEIVETIRAEVATNKVSNDVLIVFGARERTRSVITLRNLHLSMKSLGFKHNKAEYAKVLEFLAKLGLGYLDVDSKRRVRALKDIKVTLQSIGAVAFGAKASLTMLHKRNKFLNLVPKLESPVKTAPTIQPAKDLTVSLVVHTRGKTLSIPIPIEFTAIEIAQFIAKIQGNKAS